MGNPDLIAAGPFLEVIDDIMLIIIGMQSFHRGCYNSI